MEIIRQRPRNLLSTRKKSWARAGRDPYSPLRRLKIRVLLSRGDPLDWPPLSARRGIPVFVVVTIVLLIACKGGFLDGVGRR